MVTFAAADNTLAERIVAVNDALDDIANNGGATDAVAGESLVFGFGSDSYIYISDGVLGVGANDVLIQLVGIASGTGTDQLTLSGGNITALAPAGVAGSPINLALTNPADAVGDVTVTIAGVPSGWNLNQGVANGDGTWTIDTGNIAALTITSPGDYTGAMVFQITQSWTNADGSTSTTSVADNVEVYAPGNPIFAWSGDDTLTGSSGNDLFVFAQPIGRDIVHSFDAAHDQIDLIGYAGLTSFADVQANIANDANGDAVLTLGDGQSITLAGVDTASLTASNFAFDQEPVTNNAGIMTIDDGAMLPLSGTINNTGTIALDSSGSATELELIQYGVTLQGGGQVVLSDSGENVITGTGSSVTLTNLDNTISGAGRLGGGQMTLDNAGTINATGSNALEIDTGDNAVLNSGTLEATGSGGLIVHGDVANSGLLWANGGNVTVEGDVSGTGSVLLDGSATVEFGGAVSQNIAIDADASATLKIDHANNFSSTISGLDGNDKFDFSDIDFGAQLTVNYSANQDGTGGTLILSDGTDTANIHLAGLYAADNFHTQADGGAGTLVTYMPQPDLLIH